jgi:hypothetical protein
VASSSSRPKSGKKEKKKRPLTALDKWSEKDQVQNMSKLVAWDRPEDEN